MKPNKLFLICAFLSAVLLTSIPFMQDRDELGDVNDDGIVNILDVVRVVNIVLENAPPPSEYESWSSDVNNDDLINVQDIIIVVELFLGTLAECPDQQVWCMNNLTQCCYDTTSHEFYWEVQIVGAEGFNNLWDCTILSPDSILFVGEIQLQDMQGSEIANCVLWDSQEFEYIQVIAPEYPYVDPLYSTFSINPPDIWVASGGMLNFNGQFWDLYSPYNSDLPNGLGACYHIWGTSEKIYHSRNSGDIVEWDGEHFHLMETTTGSGSEFDDSLGIIDLWGIDLNHIWTIAGKPDLLNEEYPRKLSFYNGVEWIDKIVVSDQEFVENELCGWMFNVWAYGDSLYVSTANFGVWKESISTGVGYFCDQPSEQVNYTGKGIHGNHYNDILTTSALAKYAHYNGIDWSYKDEVFELLSSIDGVQSHYCHGFSFKNDIVVMYGTINSGSQAWIAVGLRDPND